MAPPPMAPPPMAPPPMAPPPQDMGMSGEDEQMLMAGLSGAQNVLGDLDAASNVEEAINAIRQDAAPLEARRNELAEFVGPEDAARTPDSVLLLLQPVIIMEQTSPVEDPIDAGVGGLAAGAMDAPVEGPMAEGIMSTVNMDPGPEAPMEGPPVNFNQGGNVRLAEILQGRRDTYRDQMGATEAELEAATEAARNTAEANILFDAAAAGLNLAAGPVPGGSVMQNLAAAFSPVLANVPGRAAPINAVQADQKEYLRSLDLAALSAAEAARAAELKAQADEREALIKASKPGEAKTPKLVQVVDELGRVRATFNSNNPTQTAQASAFVNANPGSVFVNVGTTVQPTASASIIMGNADLMSRYGSGETNDEYDSVINAELTKYFDVVRETVYDKGLNRNVIRETQRNIPPAVRKAIDARIAAGLSVPVIASSTSTVGSPAVGSPSADTPPTVGSPSADTPPTVGSPSAGSPSADTPPTVLSREQVLGLINLPSTPINVLEDVEAMKAFGLGAAARDFANRIVGLGNGTMFPETQESITALEGLNSRYAAAVLAALEGKDSVFQSQRVRETLPTPSSILTSTDRARAQARSTVATINKGLQILERELLDPQTPLTEADVATKTRQMTSLLGFRYAYEQIAKDPSTNSGSTYNPNVLENRIENRKSAAKAAVEQNSQFSISPNPGARD
jgi:hypothetical protein